MIGTIRKHRTWLWAIIITVVIISFVFMFSLMMTTAIIITVVIISFVFMFSPYSKMNNASRGPVNLGSINGERVSEEDFIKARAEVYLRDYFTSGNWPDEEAKKAGGQIERETYQWLLLIQKQQQFGVHVSTDVVAQAARAMVSQFQ